MSSGLLGPVPSATVGRDVRLRSAVLGVGLCGTVGVATAGLLSPSIAAALCLCLLIGAGSAHLGLRRPIRTAAALTVLGLVGAGAIVQLGHGTDVVRTLAIATVALLVVQQTLADTRRELGVTAAIGLSLLLLAAGLTPSPSLVGPLLLGWVAALTTGVLIGPGNPAAGGGADPAHHTPGAPGSGGVRPHTVAVLHTGATHRRPAVAVVVPAAALSVLGALVLVLLVPLPDRTTAAQGVLERLTGTTPIPAGRGLGTYTGDDLDMRVRGRLPSTPVATVPWSSPRLWRAAVLSRYDGTRWHAPTLSSPLGQTGDSAGRIDVTRLLTDRAATGAPPAAPRGALTAYTVQLAPGAGQMLLLPGHAQSVTAARAAAVQVGSDRLLLVSADGTFPEPSRYAVTSLDVPDAAAIPGPAVGAAGPGPAVTGSDEWVRLPATVTARTRRLAVDITRGATNRGEQVSAVHRYLSATYLYTLDAAVPPRGHDAVDDFLFETREGFCEQFAAAEVVLLRSLGVPSRMATGFAGGKPDGAGRELRASDAHAWVEVYQPGVGWAPSDPTPAADTLATTSVASRLRTVFTDPHQRHVAAAALLALAALVVGLMVLARRRANLRARVARGQRDDASSRDLGRGRPARTARRDAGRAVNPGPGGPGRGVRCGAAVAVRAPSAGPGAGRPSPDRGRDGPTPGPGARRDERCRTRRCRTRRCRSERCRSERCRSERCRSRP